MQIFQQKSDIFSYYFYYKNVFIPPLDFKKIERGGETENIF